MIYTIYKMILFDSHCHLYDDKYDVAYSKNISFDYASSNDSIYY